MEVKLLLRASVPAQVLLTGDKRYTLLGKGHDWATCPVSPFPEA